MHRQFHTRRAELLRRRKARREEIARTGRLDFLPDTSEIRAGEWTVAPAPADLQDRRVEITGPTEPKMAINALNSGARVWLADLEDANTPHWSNVVTGQLVLRDAVRRQLALRVARRQELRIAAGERPCGHGGAPARLALRRAARDGRRRSRRSRAWSISACTSSTTRRNYYNAAPVPITTCRKRRVISKSGSGTTCSPGRRSGLASRTAPSAPRSLSRRSRPPSR